MAEPTVRRRGTLTRFRRADPVAANDARAGFSPDNWAHQALMQMDEAEALVRWASVSMTDTVRYHRSAQAFWAVVHLLAAERERLEPLLRADPPRPRRRASRRRGDVLPRRPG